MAETVGRRVPSQSLGPSPSMSSIIHSGLGVGGGPVCTREPLHRACGEYKAFSIPLGMAVGD